MKLFDRQIRRFSAIVVMAVLVSGMVLFSAAEEDADTATPENTVAAVQAEAEPDNAGETAAPDTQESAEPEAPGASEQPAEPEEPAQPEESEETEQPAAEEEAEEEAEVPAAEDEAETDQKENVTEEKNKEDKAAQKDKKDSSDDAEETDEAEAAGSAYVIPRNNRERKYQIREDNVVLTSDFNQDGMEDLIVIQQSGTKSGKVELHILSGESNYYSYLDVIELDLDPVSGWTFLMADYDPDRGIKADDEATQSDETAVPDLYAICSDEEKTVLYVFDGDTDYQEQILKTELPIAAADYQDLTYLTADADGDQVMDLYIVDSGKTASGSVEVTVLDGADHYQSIQQEFVTAFELPAHEDETTEALLDFGLYDYNEDGRPDLYVIEKAATESGKVEVSVLAAASEADGTLDTDDGEAAAGGYEEFLEEHKETHLDLPEAAAQFIVPEEAVNIQVFYTEDTKSGCVEGYLMAYRGAATISEGAYLEALRYEGNPYVWGGESLVSGVDCSGLVKVIYEKFDVHMAHSSLLMRYAGTTVDSSDLQVGDLLCYDGHIGFYAGDGQLYSALGTKHGIRYNSAYYKPILTIRRIK